MSVRTPKRPVHSRTESLADVSTKTQVLAKSIGVDESLRSYKLLEGMFVPECVMTSINLIALKTGDRESIDKYILFSSHAPDSRTSIGSSHAPDSVQPLVLAVQCADTKTVEYVLGKQEVDINGRDLNGNTALHFAAQLGRADVIDLLMDHPDINDTMQNNDRKQAFQLANNGELAHHMQVKRGVYIEKVNQSFAQALKTKDDSLTDLLDNPRAGSLLDLNRTDADGNTPLHTAVISRDASLVNLLLNHGADAFPRNKKGKLPTDLAKDDKIKTLFKNIPQKTMLNASPSDPIRYSGHLKKWTNYKSGYKARWFVLENGVLSYYRNQHESENACRGSINMKVAKIVYQNGDKTKFEVLGPDKNGFHVKAAHPTEAKNWIWNLNQAKTQCRDASKLSTSRDLTGAPIANADTSSVEIPQAMTPGHGHQGSYAPSLSGSMYDAPRSTPPYGDNLAPGLPQGLGTAYSDAGSEIEDFDDNFVEEPHQDIFGLTANTAKVQLEIMDQICDSILTERLGSGNPLDPRMHEAAETFRSSATSLRDVLTQLVVMANDREKYWKNSIDHEREIRRLWEENMHALANDQDELERKVYEANQERRNTKKALRQARTELSQAKASTPVMTPTASSANIQNPLVVPANAEPYFMDSDSSDDEFYDAVGNDSSTNLARSTTQPIEPATGSSGPTSVPSVVVVPAAIQPTQSISAEAKSAVVPTPASSTPGQEPHNENQVAVSFHGYENPIRTDMGRLDDRPAVSLWGILKSMIGKDMTKMTLPVSFNEATSLLQRVAEDMEYTDTLDKAAASSDPTERALYVAAFAASEYSSTIDRVAKPFNPLLHETYEYCRPDKGFRFIVEQVSHHPPIGAAHAQANNWEYYGESSVKSKFTGKSFDINPLGTWYCRLKLSDGSTELYTWKKVNTAVVGILLGNPTVDNYGPMVVTNTTNGVEARLDFKARGWRGADAYKVTGTVVDQHGAEKWVINGKWNEKIFARRSGEKGDNIIVWASNPRRKGVPFNLTTFAMSLNALDDNLKPWLPPTDTRLRPDQRAMEEGQYDFAATEKNRLEEKQRATRRMREKQGLEHGARWFKQSKHPVTQETYWEFTGEYWEARERAGAKQAAWPGVEDIF